MKKTKQIPQVEFTEITPALNFDKKSNYSGEPPRSLTRLNALIVAMANVGLSNKPYIA